MGCLSELRSGDVGGDMDEVNVFNPDLNNCEERYDDLCDYFNNDPKTIKAILWDRKAFRAWLERVKWHVQECDRLGRELEKIIYCKDCKWFQCNMRPDGYLPKGVDEFECRHWCGPCDPVDFCSRAERREE